MKRIFLIAASLICVIFTACKNESDKSNTATGPVANPEVQTLPAANNPVLTPGNDSPQQATGNIALNPQHGQPGHRCDIAVGAPLNSPSTNTATIQQPAITTTIPPANNANNVAPPVIAAPTTNAAGVKLNPQHGQPGHRCDIAVGAPLDSKPKQ